MSPKCIFGYHDWEPCFYIGDRVCVRCHTLKSKTRAARRERDRRTQQDAMYIKRYEQRQAARHAVGDRGSL